ncbi:hypothetical protein FGB62_160g00 [Gracilaria domingensis]|nr:hypothetical protein FGB62_160g00 [Gracilaria domingensis]
MSIPLSATLFALFPEHQRFSSAPTKRRRGASLLRHLCSLEEHGPYSTLLLRFYAAQLTFLRAVVTSVSQARQLPAPLPRRSPASELREDSWLLHPLGKARDSPGNSLLFTMPSKCEKVRSRESSRARRKQKGQEEATLRQAVASTALASPTVAMSISLAPVRRLRPAASASTGPSRSETARFSAPRASRQQKPKGAAPFRPRHSLASRNASSLDGTAVEKARTPRTSGRKRKATQCYVQPLSPVRASAALASPPLRSPSPEPQQPMVLMASPTPSTARSGCFLPCFNVPIRFPRKRSERVDPQDDDDIRPGPTPPTPANSSYSRERRNRREAADDDVRHIFTRRISSVPPSTPRPTARGLSSLTT